MKRANIIGKEADDKAMELYRWTKRRPQVAETPAKVIDECATGKSSSKPAL